MVQSDINISPRYNHTAVQFGSKLVIFGGMNQDMTLEMSVTEIEMDTSIVDQKLKKEQSEANKIREQEVAKLKNEFHVGDSEHLAISKTLQDKIRRTSTLNVAKMQDKIRRTTTVNVTSKFGVRKTHADNFSFGLPN